LHIMQNDQGCHDGIKRILNIDPSKISKRQKNVVWTVNPGYPPKSGFHIRTLYARIIYLIFFFFPLLLWLFLVCFACNTLINICDHSHSHPLTRYYVSNLMSTFAETTPGPMTHTREFTHLTNRVTSQFELVTLLF